MAQNKRELQILMTMKDKMSASLNNTKKHLTTFESGVSRLGATIAGAFSVYAITNFAQKSIELANAQINAETKLATSIANVKGAREGDYEALLQQASALQQVTAIGDEEIINNQALLATFQLTGDQIQQLVPRILDMGAANARTGELTEDLKASTMAVGKAFTSGVGMLSRYGVAMSEAQKEAFALADQEEKVALLTQILDDNFKGTAETIGQTFAGRVERAKNNVNDLREGIGFALMPTLEGLVSNIIDTTNSYKENDNWINTLAKGIYRATNFIISLGKAAGLLVSGLTFLADNFISVSKVVFNFAKDIVQAFFNIKDNVMGVIKALGQALTGDFDGAMESLKNIVRTNLDDTASSFDDLLYNTQGWTQQMGDQWDSLGASMVKAVDLEGYKPIEKAAVEAYRTISDTTNKTEGELEGNAKEVEKLAKEYQDFEESASDALSKLESEHRDNLSSIRNEIAKTEQDLADLNKSYAEEKKSDTQRIAEQVVATEERIAEIQEELAEGVSGKRQAELQDELARQQEAYNNNKAFIESIENAVVEARRRASLTDLEREIEDFNQRRALAEAEFNEKTARIQAELEQLRNKEKQEIALYNEKKNIIEALRIDAAEQYQEQLENEFQMTKEAITAEIDLYQQLAKAIAAVRGGSATDLSGIRATAMGAKSNINNINLTVNGDISGKDLIDKVSEGIMNNIRMNQRLAV